MSEKRPTIAESEAVPEKGGGDVEITYNGEVFVRDSPCPSCASLRAENARLRAAELVATLVERDQREFKRWTLGIPKDVYNALVVYRRAYGEGGREEG